MIITKVPEVAGGAFKALPLSLHTAVIQYAENALLLAPTDNSNLAAYLCFVAVIHKIEMTILDLAKAHPHISAPEAEQIRAAADILKAELDMQAELAAAPDWPKVMEIIEEKVRKIMKTDPPKRRRNASKTVRVRR